MAATKVWPELWVMTSRPRTYGIVVDVEAWPSAGATLRTSEPASTALVAKVRRMVCPGKAGAVAEPATRAMRR